MRNMHCRISVHKNSVILLAPSKLLDNRNGTFQLDTVPWKFSG